MKKNGRSSRPFRVKKSNQACALHSDLERVAVRLAHCTKRHYAFTGGKAHHVECLFDRNRVYIDKQRMNQRHQR